MKQEIAPPPDLTDPLVVLEGILGKSLREIDGNGVEAGPLDKLPELVEDIEFEGLSLKDFVDEEEKISEDEAESIYGIEECEYVWP